MQENEDGDASVSVAENDSSHSRMENVNHDDDVKPTPLKFTTEVNVRRHYLWKKKEKRLKQRVFLLMSVKYCDIIEGSKIKRASSYLTVRGVKIKGEKGSFRGLIVKINQIMLGKAIKILSRAEENRENINWVKMHRVYFSNLKPINYSRI